MEKRDALFLLLVFGGAGYAVYANWETIALKLDLQEFNPGELQAVDLCKNGSDFTDGIKNWQHVSSLEQRGMIKASSSPWSAKLVSGQSYQVVVRWTEGGIPKAHGFAVNIATRTYHYQGLLEMPASPR